MEKVYKSLKVGEITQVGDEVFILHFNGWQKVNHSFVIGVHNSPIRREINVIEIPAIPDGFRELTQEDIDKNIKGEVKSLVFNNEGWKWQVSSSQTKYFILKHNISLIIKPAPKGLSKENYKPEMRLRAKESKEFVSRINSSFDIVMFDNIPVGASFKELNKNYQVFDKEKQAWIDCAEYEG